MKQEVGHMVEKPSTFSLGNKWDDIYEKDHFNPTSSFTPKNPQIHVSEITIISFGDEKGVKIKTSKFPTK